jgi:transposase
MAKRGAAYPAEFRRQMVELVRAGRYRRNWRASSNRRRSQSGTGSSSQSATQVEVMAVCRQRSALKRLRRKNRQLKLERRSPQSRPLVLSGDECDHRRVPDRERSAGRLSNSHDVSAAVSSSDYYAWKKRQPPLRFVRPRHRSEPTRSSRAWSSTGNGGRRS